PPPPDAPRPAPHSFPTRRSSDLGRLVRSVDLSIETKPTASSTHTRSFGEVAGTRRIDRPTSPFRVRARRAVDADGTRLAPGETADRKSTRLNSSHVAISYAVFCL